MVEKAILNNEQTINDICANFQLLSPNGYVSYKPICKKTLEKLLVAHGRPVPSRKPGPILQPLDPYVEGLIASTYQDIAVGCKKMFYYLNHPDTRKDYNLTSDVSYHQVEEYYRN